MSSVITQSIEEFLLSVLFEESISILPAEELGREYQIERELTTFSGDQP